MEERRYWVRHPSLSGHAGPIDAAALRQQVESGALPDDSFVLPDDGQELTARQQSVAWRPAYELLGLPAPPGLTPPLPKPPRESSPRERRLRGLRNGGAYGRVRAGAELLSILAVFVVLLVV